MGVAVIDTLLSTSVINKSRHEKLYKTYFKINLSYYINKWKEILFYLHIQLKILEILEIINQKTLRQNSQDQLLFSTTITNLKLV